LSLSLIEQSLTENSSKVGTKPEEPDTPTISISKVENVPYPPSESDIDVEYDESNGTVKMGNSLKAPRREEPEDYDEEPEN
jgi:hypothetical protein